MVLLHFGNPMNTTAGRLTRVLLVEDEPAIALEFRDALKDLGYRVLDPAVTGEEAIRVAEQERPDIVVMDVSLAGELSGTQAAQIIHGRFAIPVVYLTGYANRATMEEIRVAGGGGVLQKPVRMSDLHAAIQRAMRAEPPDTR
jgi:CheY-like chemotaxis protein